MCPARIAASSRAIWLVRVDRPIHRHCAPGSAGHRGHATSSVGSVPRHISPQALHSAQAAARDATAPRVRADRIQCIRPLLSLLFGDPALRAHRAWRDKGTAGEAGRSGLPERPCGAVDACGRPVDQLVVGSPMCLEDVMHPTDRRPRVDGLAALRLGAVVGTAVNASRKRTKIERNCATCPGTKP